MGAAVVLPDELGTSRNTVIRPYVRLRLAFISASLIGSGLLVACSSASTDPAASLLTKVDSVKAALLGSWTLVGGCGGLIGQCQPATALNEPQRYVFRADSVEAYRGGQRVWTLNYVITPGATDPSRGDTRPTLLVGIGPTVDPRPLRVQFSGDTTLILDEGCCDRYAFEYRRNR
jgi:hypothetical protein